MTAAAACCATRRPPSIKSRETLLHAAPLPSSFRPPRYTEKSDVWAFGITCYEVFTAAQRPYDGMNNEMVLVRVKGGYRLPCPEGCPEKVYQDVLKPCWAADPNARPTFVELKDRVGAAQGGHQKVKNYLSEKSIRAAQQPYYHVDHSGSTASGSTRNSNRYVGSKEGLNSTSSEKIVTPETINEAYLDMRGADGQTIRASDDITAGRCHHDWKGISKRAKAAADRDGQDDSLPKIHGVVKIVMQPSREPAAKSVDLGHEAGLSQVNMSNEGSRQKEDLAFMEAGYIELASQPSSQPAATSVASGYEAGQSQANTSNDGSHRKEGRTLMEAGYIELETMS